MDFIKTILFSLSVLGCALWVGAMIQAKHDEKLEVACHPIDFAVEKIQVVATGLIGRTPQWTFKAREVLVGGCYYFFSTFLFADEKGIGKQTTGVHK